MKNSFFLDIYQERCSLCGCILVRLIITGILFLASGAIDAQMTDKVYNRRFHVYVFCNHEPVSRQVQRYEIYECIALKQQDSAHKRSCWYAT